jgi:hypothetical protein
METTALDGAALEQASAAFGQQLAAIKQAIGPDFPWYPYQSLSNFVHLRPILQDTMLDSLVAGGQVLDIGAADGEIALFLNSLGYGVDVVDHAPTNYNGLRGVRLLADHLNAPIGINDVDLDSQFTLPATGAYNLVFLLGILYHLKNPYFVLERLARSARHLLLSTRVARFAPNGQPIHGIAVGYLLGPTESNNDATNYWVFSETGLKQLFHRTGWDVVSYLSVGDTVSSDPARPDRDERAFALLRSRNF